MSNYICVDMYVYVYLRVVFFTYMCTYVHMLGSAQTQQQSPKGILVIIVGPYYNITTGLLLYLG